jgi:4-hydroxybenzoate polyprenyltransferase
MLPFGRRLLPILQLTRMALAFTALADSLCALILSQQRAGVFWTAISPRRAAALGMVSVGLYGFGMSLNDIIDRRRDQQLASHRPLPSGRIGVAAAHVICVLLALMAAVGTLVYSADEPDGQMSLMLFFFTVTLIVFYDLAGKYLVAPGLLTLGLIRLFNAALPAPRLPVPWQPMLLLNHIALVSTFAYQWEQKRPPLTKRHWWAVFGGLAGMNGLLIFAVTWRRHDAAALAVTPGLVWPALAVVGFILTAIVIRKRNRNARQAGGTLMLTGLLWLIVYDAAFVAGYVGFAPAGLILCLLPIAYLSVQLMRWWSRILSLSQRPAYKRVET